MRMRRAHNVHVRLPRKMYIVAVTAPAREQSGVFASPDRLANQIVPHRRPPLLNRCHRSLRENLDQVSAIGLICIAVRDQPSWVDLDVGDRVGSAIGGESFLELGCAKYTIGP